MVYLSAGLFGKIGPETHRMALVVELLHLASLIHDDVIDHDEIRRGRESVNGRWGNSVAVLVGDYLLAQLMKLLDEVDDRNATRRIIQTVTAMTEAELLAQELQATDGNRRSTYLQIIDGKTACLFATACALGNPECYDLGLCYGRLFQLYDDIADGEATVETDTLIAAEMPRWNTLADQWPGIVAQLPSYDCNKTAQTNTK
jgi:octaprenyl-diphosphate synthase